MLLYSLLKLINFNYKINMEEQEQFEYFEKDQRNPHFK